MIDSCQALDSNQNKKSCQTFDNSRFLDYYLFMFDFLVVPKEVQMESPDLYTVSDLAKTFGKSRQTIYNWIEAGKFPNHFIAGQNDGSNILLVPVSDVDVVREEEAQKLLNQLERLGFQATPA